MEATRRLPLGDELERGPEVTVTIDGRPTTAHVGETVAAVLFAEGAVRTRTTVGGAPRGVFCGMGVCFDCLVVVDGVPNTRACMTWVRDGMRVELQEGLGDSWPALL
jgi:predicted molibdopterin-dependent oxidoreductase YjgC